MCCFALKRDRSSCPIPVLAGISLIVGGINLSAPVWALSAGEYRQQGLARRDQGDYPGAIAALRKAVELEPTNLSGQVLLGWTYHKAGNASDASATLTQAIVQDPFHVPALNALGIVHLVGGHLEAAAYTHLWAYLLKSDNEIAAYNLSLTCQRLGQYDWAIATAQTAARLEPQNPHPLIAEAIAHWSNGDRAVAQSTFQRATSLDGRYGNTEYLNFLREAGFSAEQITIAQEIERSS